MILQRYKDGGLADAKVFRLADGLTWRLGDRIRTETDLRPWLATAARWASAAERFPQDAEVRRIMPEGVRDNFECPTDNACECH